MEKISTSSRYAWVLLAFVLLSFATGLLYHNRDEVVREREYLIATVSNVSAASGPVLVFNTASRSITFPPIQGVGCSGAALMPNSSNGEVLVSCVGPETTDNFWDLNLIEGTATPHEYSSIPHQNIEITGHPIIRNIDDENLLLSAGGARFTPDGYINDAAVVFMNADGSSSTVYISDRMKTYFILNIALDRIENKAWVMSVGDSETILIDRIDISTKKIDFSHTLKSFAGNEILINGNDVLISMFRNAEGSDLVVIDKVSGVVRQNIQLPVRTDEGYNALSMLRRGERLFVGGAGGIFELDPHTYAVLDFIAYDPETHFNAFINGAHAMYAIDRYERILEISPNDLSRYEAIFQTKNYGLTRLELLNI